MNTRSINPLLVLVLSYVLVARQIFSWLYFLRTGDPYLLKPAFAWAVPQTYLPIVIGLVCVAGLSVRQQWAWWLTAVALLHEVVTYVLVMVPPGQSYFSLGVGAIIKLCWLAAIGVALFRVNSMFLSQPTISKQEST
jgi:uncharacterized membrane protein YecN with MAPEG domain